MTTAYENAGVIDAGEPPADTAATAGQMADINPDKLELLGEQLASRRDDWVSARAASKVERRWREDTDQYNERDKQAQESTMMDTVQNGGPTGKTGQKQTRSKVFVNITRAKTNAAEARLANMLFPTDDRNWGISPTPNPKLSRLAEKEAEAAAARAAAPMPAQPGAMPTMPAGAAMPPGAPGAMPQPPVAMPGMTPMAGAIGAAMGQAPIKTATEILAEAARRADGMQTEIHDQLTECDFNAQGRLMIHDAAVLGTGVLKGPLVVNRVRKAWKKLPDSDVYQLEIIEEKKPASERVDPRNVYPDPSCGEDIHNGIGIFERKVYTSKQLRDLAKQPGYLKEQISKVLEEGPKQTTTSRREEGEEDQKGSEHFEAWEYWGEFTPEDLRAAGVKIEDGSTASVSGCIIFVNNHVIKGFLNPIETGDLPYDFFVWEKVDGSCWGKGIPRLMRSAQAVLNAAWRQLMDNSGMSVGPQFIVKPSIIQPADNKWELTGRKIWFLTDAAADARMAFAQFDVPNRVAEMKQIIEMAQQFGDEESNVPMLAQGERGTAPETVGGMTLLMNSSNVVLGRLVKQYDDMITRPHIRRYYDWNMAYSDKADIKGDFGVDPRGSSVLLVKDQQQQALMGLASLQGTPVGQMVNWNEWVKEVMKAQHIDATKILKTDEEIKALQNQPSAPNPEMIKAETAIKVAQIKADTDLKITAHETQGELAYAAAQAQMARDNNLANIEELRLKRELALAEFMQKHQLTNDQLRAMLADTAMKEQTKRQLAAASHAVSVSQARESRDHDMQQAAAQSRADVAQSIDQGIPQ